MSKNLVLFDVDGILIGANAVSYDYWREVVRKHYGLNVSRNEIYMEGKTDKGILKELLELKGIKKPLSDKRFERALNEIGFVVKKAIRNQKIVKTPNVEKLLKRLVEHNHIIGLLTGNTREKAKVKLLNCGLWKYFKVVAFGDASEKRSELVTIAINDAIDKTGIKFSNEDVFVVGDTVRDIQCAKEAGVRSLIFATGKESIEMLKKEKPDFIFKDFSNIDRIMIVFEKKRHHDKI